MPRFQDEHGFSLFDHDEKMGRTVWARTNDDGTTTFRTDYRVDDIIRDNTAMRNAASPGWKGDWHKVASIPLNIYYDQLHEATVQDDHRYVSRWLNDSDRRAWRSKDGQV